MTDFIELLIKTIIISFISDSMSESRFAVTALHGLVYALVGYFVVVRPQVNATKNTRPIFSVLLVIFWVLILSSVLCGLWFRFEIWPGLLLLIVFYRGLEGKKIGFMRWIPSLRKLESSLILIKELHNVSQAEFDIYHGRKPREDLEREDLRAFALVRNAPESAVFCITLASGIPAFWLCCVSAFLFQPVVVIFQGNTSTIPVIEFICNFGCGLFVHFFVFGYSFWTTAIAFDATHSKVAQKTAKEISIAKRKIDLAYEELTGGDPMFVLKIVLLLLIGGVGVGVHLSRISS